MSIDAMKLALEALEGFIPYLPLPDKAQCGRYDKAITALRAAIEQAQDKHEDWCASLTQLLMSMPPKPAPCNCKLKTAQREPRQWQGLTNEDREDILRWIEWKEVGSQPVAPQKLIAYVERKLREKNHV